VYSIFKFIQMLIQLNKILIRSDCRRNLTCVLFGGFLRSQSYRPRFGLVFRNFSAASKQSPYDILAVSPFATDKEIKLAYYKLAKVSCDFL
jgi:hypothetical protein